jgi:hypothetical protein
VAVPLCGMHKSNAGRRCLHETFVLLNGQWPCRKKITSDKLMPVS